MDESDAEQTEGGWPLPAGCLPWEPKEFALPGRNGCGPHRMGSLGWGWGRQGGSAFPRHESQAVPTSDGALSVFLNAGPLWSQASSCPRALPPQESGGDGDPWENPAGAQGRRWRAGRGSGLRGFLHCRAASTRIRETGAGRNPSSEYPRRSCFAFR